MYILIKEGICSKYELDNCYTLFDFIKLYSIWQMTKDIEQANIEEIKNKQ